MDNMSALADYFMFFLLDEKELKNQENRTLYGAPKQAFLHACTPYFHARE